MPKPWQSQPSLKVSGRLRSGNKKILDVAREAAMITDKVDTKKNILGSRECLVGDTKNIEFSHVKRRRSEYTTLDQLDRDAKGSLLACSFRGLTRWARLRAMWRFGGQEALPATAPFHPVETKFRYPKSGHASAKWPAWVREYHLRHWG